MLISLDKIRTDSPAREEINPRMCDEYAADMERGDKFPPMLVYQEGDDYHLADGFHRYIAYRSIERVKVNCTVIQGSRSEALWNACGANKDHGLRRSNKDKWRAVRIALGHPKGVEMSNGSIAEHCGVSDVFVGKVRRKMEDLGEASACALRLSKSGRTIDTDNIGAVAEETEDRPVHEVFSTYMPDGVTPNTWSEIDIPVNCTTPLDAALSIVNSPEFDVEFLFELVRHLTIAVEKIENDRKAA